jgi:hypothetical protein
MMLHEAPATPHTVFPNITFTSPADVTEGKLESVSSTLRPSVEVVFPNNVALFGATLVI